MSGTGNEKSLCANETQVYFGGIGEYSLVGCDKIGIVFIVVVRECVVLQCDGLDLSNLRCIKCVGCLLSTAGLKTKPSRHKLKTALIPSSLS